MPTQMETIEAVLFLFVTFTVRVVGCLMAFNICSYTPTPFAILPFLFFLSPFLFCYHSISGPGNLHYSLFRTNNNMTEMRPWHYVRGQLDSIVACITGRADTLWVSWNVRGLNQPAKRSRVFSQ